MRVSDHYANNFLRADDFDARGRELTIQSVEVETVGKEDKPVVHFVGEDKTLPLNKTNALEIAEIHGDEMDEWTGKKIRIYQTKTEYNGRRVPCMRVSEPLSAGETPKADPASGSGSGSGKGKKGSEATA